MALIRYPILQYAYVVNDIETACRHWTELVGAGPFFVSPHHVSESHFHRGEPNRADLSYAFGQAGPAHIQLIQQHNDAPSVYRDLYPAGSQGFHHVAILPTDFDAEKARFEAAGFPAVTTLVSAARVAYMDTRAAFGAFVEVYEDNAALRETFAFWKEVHDNWDGRDPIRLS
ncbi:MAG: VOC family protein [Pseudomonadales bacterium]|nr:VOC family protein [Pseudomonadales bacterium]MCP5182658.1 VOC family protein [Pseudomonadales bacterium]